MKLQDAIRGMKPGDRFVFGTDSEQYIVIGESGIPYFGSSNAYVALITRNLELDGEIIPKKDDPMSAEEFAKYMLELQQATHTYKEILSGKKELIQRRLPYLIKRVARDSFEQGAAENEKKHRSKQTFEEWWIDIKGETWYKKSRIISKNAWNAHAEATNTE